MVNTVALVSQQAAYIRQHSHQSVGEYSGDLNVDLWSKEQWQEELLGHQVRFADGVLQVASVVTGVLYVLCRSW
jgi:hypothetical protein